MTDALVALAERQIISLLAVRLLDATLGAGRNILVTGPLGGAMPLMVALVAQADAPGIFSASLFGEDPHDAEVHVPDRMAAWGIRPKSLVHAMVEHTSVVGHIEGGRLDRALMRYELALAREGHAQTVGVLASLDLVVVMAPNAGGLVTVVGIYEVRMAEEGYRPVQLFGLSPTLAAHNDVPTLTFLGPPSFVAEFLGQGERALVAELTGSLPAQDMPLTSSVTPEPVQSVAPRRVPAGPPQRSAPTARVARGPVAPSRVAQAPGWELDRLLGPESGPEQTQDSPQDSLGALSEASAFDLDEEPGQDEGPLGLEPPPKPSQDEPDA